MSDAKVTKSVEKTVKKIAVLRAPFHYSYPSVWSSLEPGSTIEISGDGESFGDNLLTPEGVMLCRGNLGKNHATIIPAGIIDVFEVETEVTTLTTKRQLR